MDKKHEKEEPTHKALLITLAILIIVCFLGLLLLFRVIYWVELIMISSGILLPPGIFYFMHIVRWMKRR